MGKAPKSQEDIVELKLIGEKIRMLRKSNNLSQDEVALASNIARSHYGEIDRGERNPTALTLIQIAHVLGVAVGELFPEQKVLKKIQKARNKPS